MAEKEQTVKMVNSCKPPIDWVKLNVDGSFQGNLGNCRGGVLIHGDFGMAHGAFSILFDQRTNNEVEMRAHKEGVELCKEIDFSQITIKCDSVLVANWFSTHGCTVWYLWDYWEDLLRELNEISYRIVHQFREGNQAVYFFAHKGEEGSLLCYFSDMDLPPLLKEITLQNRLGLPNIRIK